MITKLPFIDTTTALSVKTDDGSIIAPGLEADHEIRALQVPLSGHGERLDKALVASLPEFSRAYLQRLIVEGCISSPQQQVFHKPSTKVVAGQRLMVLLRPTDESQAYRPEPMPLESIYCDPYLRVINKPVGLVVHPAPGHWSGTLLNGLLALDELAHRLPRAGIVHRLDKDTSGLMLVARQRTSMDALVLALSQRKIKREYLALVHGVWPHRGVYGLNGAIGRDPKNRLRMAQLDATHPLAKPALTQVEALDQTPAYTLLHCRLDTGRTHQIRVHLSAAGYPLVGDELYGGKPLASIHRQALHAWRLSLPHPIDAQPMSWQMAPPADFMQTIQHLNLAL